MIEPSRIGPPPSLFQRAQWCVARVLKRLGLDPLWYDVATFSWSGHVCHTCGRRSHTERVHVTHECRCERVDA